MTGVTDLDLSADAVTLLEQLVNIESVSKNEARIADAVEAALRPLAHLDGDPARQHRRRANRRWGCPSASSSPAISTPCRSTRTCLRFATETSYMAWAPAT